MDKSVGECQIYQRIAIYPLVEELLAAIEVGIAVVVIYHRGYAIEAVAVEVKFVEPILDVR